MSAEDPCFFVRVTPPGAKAERIDQSHRVMSVTYEDEEKKQDKLKLQVDNFDLQNFDHPLWKTGNKVEVSWGYPGRMSPTRTVTISKVTGSTVLSVEALDDASNMNKVQKIRAFEGMKRSDVARAIAKDHGYTGDRVHIDDTIEVLEQVSQARMTDAQLIADMARREGYEFYIDFDGFHFHLRRLDQPPQRRWHYYGDPNRGDIITWNVEKDLYSAGKTGGVTVAGRDPTKKESFKESADNFGIRSRTTLGGNVALVPGVDTKASGGVDPVLKIKIDRRTGKGVSAETSRSAASGSAVIPTSETTKETAQRQAAGVFKKATMQAIELSLEVRGDPMLVGKCIVEIVGIGTTLSGLYFVTSVHHKVGSGYTMAVKAKRDATAGAGAVRGGASANAQQAATANAVPSAGDPNTQKTQQETVLTPVTRVDPRTGRGVTTYERRPGPAKPDAPAATEGVRQ